MLFFVLIEEVISFNPINTFLLEIQKLDSGIYGRVRAKTVKPLMALGRRPMICTSMSGPLGILDFLQK
jgi:hypothetical protein